MSFWRYLHSIRNYTKLFLRFSGIGSFRKAIPMKRVRFKPITRFTPILRQQRFIQRSSAGLLKQFRSALRNLVALQYVPPIAYKQSRARENLKSNLQHRFKLLSNEQFRVNTNSLVYDRIRKVFVSNVPTDYSLMHLPNDINNYEIGDFIGSGQNAAVYELSTINNPSDGIDKDMKDCRDDLAVKMIYNFNFNEPVESLLVDSQSELVPLCNESNLPIGSMMNFRRLPKTHPNIIKVHTAFLSDWKQLANADRHYPAVLPSVENYGYIPQNPKTLYVVMQRYQMTLDDYMNKIPMNYKKAHVLLGQLLEAVAYLYNQKISHRDVKLNNILLNFSTEDQYPHLALSDFGCAFSTGSWKLHYNKADMEIGGNIAHLPPEVNNAKPSEETWIDYSKADIWAVGLIGYDIFDRTWFSLKEQSLEADDVNLSRPLFIGTTLGRVMEDMLRKDYQKRINPNTAANVINMMLFGIGKGMKNLLNDCHLKGWNLHQSISQIMASKSKTIQNIGKLIDKGLDEVATFFAADLIVSRRTSDPIQYQLRTTFMERLQKEYVWNAVEYFDDEN
ncbi:unnamed protein product [Anisakis simplex]|uniref:non-specific serine/threonine protein kinase n=1 Tax=Anisakis simplex TaxID=6269 RepID=A0A0M3K3G8_ANISI|nr:unnamed protein product [Anisakis simplex]